MVRLADIISQSKDLPAAGTVLYRIIDKAIKDSDCVVIDMSAVQSIPTIFLNASIGRIIDKWGKDAIKKNVSFKSISRPQAMKVKEYFEQYSFEMAAQ